MRLSLLISIVFVIAAIVLIGFIIAPNVFDTFGYCDGWDLLECVING